MAKCSAWERRQDLGDIALELRGAQVTELDRQQVALHAQHRRHPDGKMHVRAALLRAQLEKRVYTRQVVSAMSRARLVLPASVAKINGLSREI